MDKKKAGPNRFVSWVRDVRAEVRRVVWPTWKELRNLTLIVLVLSVVMAVLMWAFDTLFASLYSLLGRLF